MEETSVKAAVAFLYIPISKFHTLTKVFFIGKDLGLYGHAY